MTIKAFLFLIECAHIAITKKNNTKKNSAVSGACAFMVIRILRSIVPISVFNFTALKADGLEAQDSKLE